METQPRASAQVPEYIFEVSWEVCNKVGGIYTVLSTRAKTLQLQFPDKLFFIGPDVWKIENGTSETSSESKTKETTKRKTKDAVYRENPLFLADDTLFPDWQKKLKREGLGVRLGRWDIPGRPIVMLVDFLPFFAQKNEIYYQAWADHGVESLQAYGDYDEASMFSYAAARVTESFYRQYLMKGRRKNVVYQAHEWMTGMGALYLKKHVPQIATIFTTHATSIGRSIAGNNKMLYDYLNLYNGNQMAGELNMEAKHSIERQTAHHVDCFTTVSDLTNHECAALLDREADVVLKNGFEDGFVPKGKAFERQRKEAREVILSVASTQLGEQLNEETLIVATSGRYEFRNKGIDIFLESMNALNGDARLQRTVLALVTVPAYVDTTAQPIIPNTQSPFLTHNIHNAHEDRLLGMLQNMNLRNASTDRVKMLFVPCYLDGRDGVFNKSYYELLTGFDLTIYPSYYEPWGYTPLESIAFHVPTITTDLSGFGLWAQSEGIGKQPDDAVQVIHRSDHNYFQASEDIKNHVLLFAQEDPEVVKNIRERARKLAQKALWKHFISAYHEAYNIALTNCQNTVQPLNDE